MAILDGIFIHGFTESLMVQALFPLIEFIAAPEEALSTGAALFIQFEDQNIPTWEDELRDNWKSIAIKSK